ncbi:MAG: hypothetical protein IJ776_04400 [Paludibacteraceae bacterium]|nr:hypothetical protein [Paludibacteraceae bacterium]
MVDVFPRLKCIGLPPGLTDIGLTSGLLAFLQTNRPCVKGWRGTFSERFARNFSLPFRHADIEIGWRRVEEPYPSNTCLTLRFDDSDDRPYLEFNEFSSGSSAGNNGGGVYCKDLPADFLKTETLLSFAERLPSYKQIILKNELLRLLFQGEKSSRC